MYFIVREWEKFIGNNGKVYCRGRMVDYRWYLIYKWQKKIALFIRKNGLDLDELWQKKKFKNIFIIFWEFR
jgi:hypothetical protein